MAKRTARGLSQPSLAKLVGISQQSMEAIENDRTKKSRYLPKIAQVLEIQLNELDDSLREDTQIPLKDFTKSLMGEKNFPVYASGEAGTGALVVTTDPVDYVRRPAPLAEVKDAYGLIIVGESMVPELRPGDTALIHPHLPPSREDCCVFYADDGNGTQRVLVKAFTRATATHWYVEQWNPPKKLTLDRQEWQKCHLIVGSYKRR